MLDNIYESDFDLDVISEDELNTVSFETILAMHDEFIDVE